MSMNELLNQSKQRIAELEQLLSQQSHINHLADADWSDDLPALLPPARYASERLKQEADGALVRFADYQQLLRHYQELQQQTDALKTQNKRLGDDNHRLLDLVTALDKSTYLGFTNSDMLNGLAEAARSVTLSSTANGHWKLIVNSFDHGEFEIQGTLTRALGKACTPFFERWADRKRRFWNNFDGALRGGRQ